MLAQQPITRSGVPIWREQTARLLLDGMRTAAGAQSCALLRVDPDSGDLLVCARSPSFRQRQHLADHYPSEACALIRVALGRESAVHAAVACASCREVFGADALFAVRALDAHGDTFVIAAFGSPARTRSAGGVRVARQLARQLARLLRLFGNEPHGRQPTRHDNRLGRRARELAMVHQIASRVASAASGYAIVENILDGARPVITCDAVAVYLRGAHATIEQPTSELLGSTGFSPTERIALDEQARAYLCSNAQVPDPEASPAECQPTTLTGLISAPLSADGRIIGGLFLGSHVAGSRLGAKEYHLAAAIADRVAVAITSAQQLRSEVRRLSALSAPVESTASSLQTQMMLQEIVREVAEELAPSSAVIALLDEVREDAVCITAHLATPAEDFIRRWPARRNTITGWIIERAEPIVYPCSDPSMNARIRGMLRPEINSCIHVPIAVKGRVVGQLSAYSRKHRHCQAHDLDLMQALAEQASVALEQAALQELVSNEKAKLEAIVESLHEGVALVGRGGLVMYATGRFAELMELDRARLAHASIDAVWSHLCGRAEQPDELRQQLRDLESDATTEITARLADARVLNVQRFAVKGTDASLGRGYVVRDITHQAEVEHLKDSLLGMVSHELRTPLAAIKGFASALLQDSLVWDRAVEHEFLVQIEQESDRMTALVRNLMDMSRLESGALGSEWERCDLVDIVQDVIGRFGVESRDHPVQLLREAERAFCVIDRHFIERVIWNLLDNAAKYSSPQRPIHVQVGSVSDTVYFKVADCGVGIGPTERERIFERFFRGTTSETTIGCGLGLAICRAVVDVHGGTIGVESELGRGSTFTVELPSRAGAER